MNRREFLIKTGMTAAGCAAAGAFPGIRGAEAATPQAVRKGVALVCDPADSVDS